MRYQNRKMSTDNYAVALIRTINIITQTIVYKLLNYYEINLLITLLESP